MIVKEKNIETWKLNCKMRQHTRAVSFSRCFPIYPAKVSETPSYSISRKEYKQIKHFNPILTYSCAAFSSYRLGEVLFQCSSIFERRSSKVENQAILKNVARLFARLHLKGLFHELRFF